MYEMNNPGILQIILSICILIAFFVAVNKISKIYDILVFFRDLELRKPENWYDQNCEKCGKGFRVSKAMKDPVKCPHCGAINAIKKQ